MTELNKLLRLEIDLNNAFAAYVTEARSVLKEAGIGRSYMFLSLQASGRVHDGELKVESKASDDSYGAVSGGSITKSLEEYMRQQGWKNTNSPLMLSHNATLVTEQELEAQKEADRKALHGEAA